MLLITARFDSQVYPRSPVAGPQNSAVGNSRRADRTRHCRIMNMYLMVFPNAFCYMSV